MNTPFCNTIETMNLMTDTEVTHNMTVKHCYENDYFINVDPALTNRG